MKNILAHITALTLKLSIKQNDYKFYLKDDIPVYFFKSKPILYFIIERNGKTFKG